MSKSSDVDALLQRLSFNVIEPDPLGNHRCSVDADTAGEIVHHLKAYYDDLLKAEKGS